ncbi:transposase [Salinibacter ruber]|uniref:IS630 family transposase n=1 Tax=Salinibacter ruber TaxID=146919 RepID=UPI00216AAAD2|nr:IS630 family transposase [Salinibacter ruber]MCS3672422.1 transposase [Salinibacter ruber]
MQYRTVRSPTDEEEKELDQMMSRAVGRVALRAQMISLSARGFSAPEIAQIHDCAEATVYKWIERFDEEGPPGLHDRERDGRSPKIDKEAEEELRRLLESAPPEEGENGSRWTAPRLARHLKEELGIEVHPETVRRALRRLGFSWTRPRRRLPPTDGEEYQRRMAKVVEAIGKVGTETTVLFEDETEIKRFPPIRRMWQPVGRQRAVDVPSNNEDFAFYGVVDVLEGGVYAERYPKEISEHTISFLESVLARTTGQVLLIWDQARWHTSQAVSGWVDRHDRLEVLLLPPRSPETNPIEDLWREMKRAVAACLERSLDRLEEACLQFLDRQTPDDILRIIGLSAV